MKIYSEELKKIKDICEINPKQEILDDNFIISFVGMAQISNDNQFDTSILKKYEDVKKGFSSFKDGDILFAKITPCMENGKGVLIENLYNGIGFGSTEFHVLRPNIEVVDRKYLYWFTMYKKFRLNCEKNMTGSAGQKRVPKNYIENYEIKLPKLIIQEKRAKILDTILRIKKEKLEQIEKLEELSKCLFIKRFKENYDKKNWENFSLEEIVEICSSKRVFLDQIVMKGIDFYRGTEIGLLSEGKKIEPKLFITKEHYENLIAETGKPKIGDLLLPSICNDGKIWYVNTEKPFYFKDGRVLWIKESDKVKGKFLQYFLRNEFLMNYKKIASGTTFSELKIFSLKKMKVKLPPIELQNQFAERVKMIEKSKFEIQKSIEETQKLFDSLMEKYFG